MFILFASCRRLCFNRIFFLTGCDPSWSSLLRLGFFLVHSYTCVGLYQFSTVIHCQMACAQKYCYAKVTTNMAIVPFAFHLTPTKFFFCETKSETMGIVHHSLCRYRWQSGARSSITRLVATSLAMKFEQGGEVCMNFHFGGKKGELRHNGGVTATANSAAGGPLAPIQAQPAWLPHHWQCNVRLFCGNLSEGGVSIHFLTWQKRKGNCHKST
jgi:hypothetical protein